MTSLYAQIRRPWASWPMTMEAHDPAGTSGIELLTDGDMEAAGTAAWTPVDATLSKVAASRPGSSGTQALRVTATAGTFYAGQAVITSGFSYRVKGWWRTDGTANPYLFFGTGIFLGSASVAWHEFDVEITASGGVSTIYFGSASATGWVEYDDVSVELIIPRTLDVSGNGRHLTLGDGAGSNEPTKLVQQRGYYAVGATAYMGIASQAWSSNRVTFETLIATPNNVGTYFIGFGTNNTSIVCALTITATGCFAYTGARTNITFAARTFVKAPRPISHLVGRYDGTNTHIFHNGVLVGSASAPTAPAAGTHVLRLFQAENGGAGITGNMYLCRIWDVALTDIEIQELARRAKRELNFI